MPAKFSMRKKLVLLMAACLMVLGGCTGTSMQIGTTLTLCCPGSYSEYSDYGVEVVNMPLFLRNYVVDEFDAAFQEKGITRDDRINDLRVVLRYNHINLSSDQQEIDPFIRVEAINVELNYIATIEIEIFETSTNRQVWGGSVSRIHQVVPGEYMHEDRARPAFEQAFRTVLASYPPLVSDES